MAHDKYAPTGGGMTPEKIQSHIDAGTFFDVLMREVKITSHRHRADKIKLELAFPEWYTKHIAKESQDKIEDLIRANAQKCHDNSAV